MKEDKHIDHVTINGIIRHSGQGYGFNLTFLDEDTANHWKQVLVAYFESMNMISWNRSGRMESSVKEKKIVYKDGEDTRVLRGCIFKEDDFFIYVHRNDGDQRIGKQFIIKIEGREI